MINPNAEDEKADSEATTILRARIKRELALVKVNADTVSLMSDTVNGTVINYPLEQGERKIVANSPPEFTEALRELRANVDRVFALAGVYR